MSMDALAAAKAYGNQMKMMQGATDPSAEESSGPSFAQMVESAMGDVVKAEQTSEALQMQSLTGGKVDLANLVTAVANAELSLNTVIAIRDRVINAYNDIIKMGI